MITYTLTGDIWIIGRDEPLPMFPIPGLTEDEATQRLTTYKDMAKDEGSILWIQDGTGRTVFIPGRRIDYLDTTITPEGDQ